MKEWMLRLSELLPEEQILWDEPMDRHTTFRVGGPCDAMVTAHSAEDCELIVRFCSAEDVPLFVLGRGSNVIVRDGGIRGVVLLIGEKMQKITVDGNRIIAEAGATLKTLCAKAIEAGLAGLEFASGIPGTVGGGVRMNAGAYGGEMAQCVAAAEALDESGNLIRVEKDALEFGYRKSVFSRKGLLILRAEFALVPGDREASLALVADLNRRRKSKQPLQWPSAGSVFKRPEGNFAGQLIEEADLKGVSIGGAQVSPMHANFIINAGGATAKDILALIDHVREQVQRNSGILLEPEVLVVGQD